MNCSAGLSSGSITSKQIKSTNLRSWDLSLSIFFRFEIPAIKLLELAAFVLILLKLFLDIRISLLEYNFLQTRDFNIFQKI